MPLWPDLTKRDLRPELMDQDGLDADEHRQALSALGRVNLLSGSAAILWPAIQRLGRSLDRPLTLLDIACGGGDVTVGLSNRARRGKVDLEILGVDKSAVAIEVARRRASGAGKRARFETMDVLQGPLPSGFDIVTCSLFLHHLSREAAVSLLRRMADAASHLVLVNDLRRSTAGYLAAKAGCQILTRSYMVREDGPQSVEAAFTIDEAAALCDDAGLAGCEIKPRWPFRFLLVWKRLEPPASHQESGRAPNP